MVKQIEGLGRKAIGVVADVTSLKEVESMIQKSVDALGPLNVMVANAGIAQVKKVLDLTEEDVRRMFDVNFFGVFNCYSSAAKQFIKQATPGKIIGAARYVMTTLPMPDPSISDSVLEQHCRLQAIRPSLPLQRQQVRRPRPDASLRY